VAQQFAAGATALTGRGLSSNYKGFPTFVKQISLVVNREAIHHETGLPFSFCITHCVISVVAY